MAVAHILGYPSIDENGVLARAREVFLQGDLTNAGLQKTCKHIRAQHWKKQTGLDFLTSGDFTLHDVVLDHAVMLGAVPEDDRFAWEQGGFVKPGRERRQWFNTSAHYTVPALNTSMQFSINAHEFLSHLDEALAQGKAVKPVLLGPVSFVYLSHVAKQERQPLLDAVAMQYTYLIRELYHRKVEWLQIDEPILGLDLDDDWLHVFERIYAWFRTQRPKILLATYFASVARYQGFITYLPVDGIHLDLVQAPAQLAPWLNALPGHWVLSAGVVDGCSAVRSDLRQCLKVLRPLAERLGERLWVAPSCSLQHVPTMVTDKQTIDTGAKSRLAFADQKIADVLVLVRGLNEGEASISGELLIADAECE